MRCYIREVDNQTNKDVKFETTVDAFAGKPYTVKAGKSWRSESSTVGLIAIPNSDENKPSLWKFDLPAELKTAFFPDEVKLAKDRGRYQMQIYEMRIEWLPLEDPLTESDNNGPKLSSEQHVKITLTGDATEITGVNLSYCIVD